MKFVVRYIREHTGEIEAATIAEAEMRARTLSAVGRFRLLSIVQADLPETPPPEPTLPHPAAAKRRKSRFNWNPKTWELPK